MLPSVEFKANFDDFVILACLDSAACRVERRWRGIYFAGGYIGNIGNKALKSIGYKVTNGPKNRKCYLQKVTFALRSVKTLI